MAIGQRTLEPGVRGLGQGRPWLGMQANDLMYLCLRFLTCQVEIVTHIMGLFQS